MIKTERHTHTCLCNHQIKLQFQSKLAVLIAQQKNKRMEIKYKDRLIIKCVKV